jgi:aerobic-type carbon monoxide dehydrogenase small subunit (CoxS/CutS family)
MTTLDLNGKRSDLEVCADMRPLLWTRQRRVEMTATTKITCGMGSCGACSIHTDGDKTQTPFCIALRVELIAAVREALASASTSTKEIDADVQAG